MKSFETMLPIHASSARVWALLVALPAWPEWNTTVERVAGSVAPGHTVTVWVRANPGRAFPVRVDVLDAPQRMVWSGGLPLGLFRGTRVFELSAAGPGVTNFRMAETYSGPLAGLIGRSIPDLQPSFDEFARCLQRAAESG